MAWSDRRYDFEEGPFKRPGQGANFLFWLLGIVAGCWVLEVLLVAVKLVDPGWFGRWFGVSSENLSRGYLWEIVTYQFVHAGATHLLLNLLGLFLVGRILAPSLGGKRLAAVCIGCGAVGALGVFLPGIEGRYVVGISGGVNGVWIVAWCLFPNLELNLFFFVARLKFVAGAFLALDILTALGGGVAPAGSATCVAWQAHLMGALGGFIYAFGWPRLVQPRLMRMQENTRRRKDVARIEKEVSDERELDRILAKINQEGMPSLTDGERRFLKRSATRYHDSQKP